MATTVDNTSNKNTSPTPVPASGASWDIFNTFLTNVLGSKSAPWIKSLWSHGTGYINENPNLANSPALLDIIMSSPNAKQDKNLDSFRRMTSIIDDLRQRKDKGEAVHVPSYYEFLSTKTTYENTLNKYGLSDVASESDLEQMIANNVSPQEMTDRISTAFDAVKNADEDLKAQLKQQYPNLSDKDIVAGLLKGPNGVDEINRRIEIAGIAAEQKRFNMGTAFSAEELYKKGYSRSAVAEKYAALQDVSTSEQRLANLYSGEAPSDVQTSLERETFTGVTSQKRKNLREKEAAAFAGASGITSSSLSKRRAGAI